MAAIGFRCERRHHLDLGLFQANAERACSGAPLETVGQTDPSQTEGEGPSLIALVLGSEGQKLRTERHCHERQDRLLQHALLQTGDLDGKRHPERAMVEAKGHGRSPAEVTGPAAKKVLLAGKHASQGPMLRDSVSEEQQRSGVVAFVQITAA